MPPTTKRGNAAVASPPIGARVAAAAALLVLAATLALLTAFTLRHVGYLLATVAGVALAVSALWVALTRRPWRWLALTLAVALIGGAVAAMAAAGLTGLALVLILAGTALSSLLGSVALRFEVRQAVTRRWRTVPGATHPVLLMNPKSGGGKVEKHHLAAEADRRGIEGVVLEAGDDLRLLAEAAVARGADVLGMAGGDGSQATVASVAAEHDLGYVCVPAGTRNHLALDLGVDRHDVVGALDAFGPARETAIDLAAVNGRTFVNNVSLGIYAAIVASDQYRDAKLKTAVETIEEMAGPGAQPFDLHVDGPSGVIDAPQLVQISNNPYVLTSLSGFGTRQRLDAGMLGVVTARIDGPADLQRLVALEAAGKVERYAGWKSWSAETLEVRSSTSVAAGIDGESCLLAPPLRFEIRPRVLRVRVAHGHPGASPAMLRAPLTASTVVGLWALVCGRPSGLVA